MSLYTLPHEIHYEILKCLNPSDYLDDCASVLLRTLAGPKYKYIKTTDASGNTFRNGKPHSYDDQPAVREHGNSYYCYNGIIHRIGGPAVIYESGVKIYYYNGHIHNESGPAIINELSEHKYYMYGIPIEPIVNKL